MTVVAPILFPYSVSLAPYSLPLDIMTSHHNVKGPECMLVTRLSKESVQQQLLSSSLCMMVSPMSIKLWLTFIKNWQNILVTDLPITTFSGLAIKYTTTPITLQPQLLHVVAVATNGMMTVETEVKNKGARLGGGDCNRHCPGTIRFGGRSVHNGWLPAPLCSWFSSSLSCKLWLML